MRTVYLVLLFLAMVALLVFLIVVIMDRVEADAHHHQPVYYAALSLALSSIPSPTLERFLLYAAF